MPIRTQKALFPIVRRLSDGAFHSGQELAREFGLSRASIFNVLRQAERLGLIIHAVRGRGYRLPDAVEWLSHAEVGRHLGAAHTAYDLNILETVDSTNSCLMSEAARGARDGTVMAAEHQFAGRGRRGRSWHAVPGGSLTFSVLWRFDAGLQALAGLSLAVGLAIARAINRHSRYPALLKWPNDVLVDYRKLAGILIEVQGDMHGTAFAVVGVGLNVQLREAQRDTIDQAVIDLAEMGVDVGRNRLLADCLVELQEVVDIYRRYGFAALRKEWLALDAYIDKPVTLHLANRQTVRGVGAGVDATGAFLLRLPDGTESAYSGGEISLRLDEHR
ncbi:MAG: biotin--[acetyl-CoA-carboxylase] ligase [Pseudomonadota bacterium]